MIDEDKLFKNTHKAKEEEEKKEEIVDEFPDLKVNAETPERTRTLTKAITLRQSFEQIRKDEKMFQGSEKVGFKSFDIVR